MTPEDHLRRAYNANINVSKDRMVSYSLTTINYTPNDLYNYEARMQPVIEIKMGQYDYEKFTEDYKRNLDVQLQIQRDPIAQDMYRKLLVYLALKF